MNTLAVLLQAAEMPVEQDGVALVVDGCSAAQLRALFAELAARPTPPAHNIATSIPVKQLDKHDRFLGEDLLSHSYAARLLDVTDTWSTLRRLKK
jgi:ATP-dependent Lhr-like helicase